MFRIAKQYVSCYEEGSFVLQKIPFGTTEKALS